MNIIQYLTLDTNIVTINPCAYNYYQLVLSWNHEHFAMLFSTKGSTKAPTSNQVLSFGYTPYHTSSLENIIFLITSRMGIDALKEDRSVSS